ncbi:MAG: DinB family protein [Candidatus Thorarchaeota archaeon]
MNWLEAVNLELGAAFAMLENAIIHADERVWNNSEDLHPFWSIAYHTIFFCHFYFSDFNPNIVNVEEEYQLPNYMSQWKKSYDFDLSVESVPSKELLLQFLKETREELRSRFSSEVSSQIGELATAWSLDETMPKGTMLLYVMRHIMQHVGELNILLRRYGLKTSEWQTLIQV